VALDVDDGGRDEDRPVGQGAVEPAEEASFPPGLVLGTPGTRIDDELVVGLVEGPGGALEEFGREGLEVGDDDPDEVGAPAAHAASHEARLVAEVGDDGLYLGDGVGGDTVAAVQNPRHGGYRHSGPLSDVFDRHPIGRRLSCLRLPLVCGHFVNALDNGVDNVVDNVYNYATSTCGASAKRGFL